MHISIFLRRLIKLGISLSFVSFSSNPLHQSRWAKLFSEARNILSECNLGWHWWELGGINEREEYVYIDKISLPSTWLSATIERLCKCYNHITYLNLAASIFIKFSHHLQQMILEIKRSTQVITFFFSVDGGVR